MANLVEETVVVKLSRLVRKDVEVESLVTEDLLTTLDAALQEVLELPAGVVVEVEVSE